MWCLLFIVIHELLQFSFICNVCCCCCRFFMDKGVFFSICSPRQAGQLDSHSLWLTRPSEASPDKHLRADDEQRRQHATLRCVQHHLNNNIWINDRHLKETLSPPWVLRFISATECSALTRLRLSGLTFYCTVGNVNTT